MVIGRYTPAASGAAEAIERAYYRQGMIYKNTEAYTESLGAVCYIPELSDSKYTHQDFLAMCNGQEEIAEEVFEAVDWQHPETYIQEQFVAEELAVCEQCGKWYWSYDIKNCPMCSRIKN